MKKLRGFAVVLLLLSCAQFACSLLAPAAPTPRVEPRPSETPAAEPSLPPPTDQSAATPTDDSTATDQSAATATVPPRPTPTATTPPLELEVVQIQAWTDRQGNARLNVLFRNPYDFPVSLGQNPYATLRNSAGDAMRDAGFYFLDGISGGTGFLLPGETVAANACFTCEEALLTEAWASVDIVTSIADATGLWDYHTEVEPTVSSVTFDGDSPLFDVAGTVKNNSAIALQRISVRITVFDPEGKLVGVSEASAWDVPAGATANFGSYGIGQTPDGEYTYEVTALGVNY